MVKLVFEIVGGKKKREVLEELSYYGITRFPYVIVRWGKRLRMFSGDIDSRTIKTFVERLNVDSIGMCFATSDDGLRINVDMAHLVANQLTDGIVEITDDQAKQWLRGENLVFDENQQNSIKDFSKKYLILKNQGDIVGIGKRSCYGVTNFLPKERRVH